VSSESLRLHDHSKLTGKKANKSKKKALSSDDRVEHELKKAAAFAARAVKKGSRTGRLRTAEDFEPKKSKKAKRSFDEELTSTSKKSLKKFRAG
jgi:hypothetical protein